jgi:geranylgeranyl pyrophosphate synthase
MDNDDLRRGRPTAHKAFDEATALLAGDALLTHAFALLATAYAAQPVLSHALIAELAQTAGSRRLVGGQMEDLLAEKKPAATAQELEFIHLNKTAAMIEASLVIGGLVGGAPAAQVSSLRAAGRDLGLAFQIIDDVLDATSDSATLGKTAGKDAQAGKATYVKLHGVEKSREMAQQLSESARTQLGTMTRPDTFLPRLVASMQSRLH